MQYLLTEEEYTAFKASQSNDNPIDDTKASDMELSAHRNRSLYRSKTLAVYGCEEMDGFIRLGNLDFDPNDVSTLDDDTWEELVDRIDEEFTRLNEPIISEDTELKDVLPNDNITLTFSEDKPYLECKISSTTLRLYPKKFEKLVDLDIKTFRILDNGSINELQITAYQKR